ncbi:GLPGLI family protein [uncultured Phocaeicola sp.]|uniref:GLPGLI family protein n=1 Tax=uncultured Phocaeicola sp. TaxID=990718 RepID=UPI0015AFF85F|nr:GLPGLI family protein [uncultured Phocaeicola sp.]
MKIVIVTLLITIPTLLFAEKKTIIEPAIMECQYDHIIVQDTLNRSHVMKDRMILRIGKNVSQFYSWYTLQGDSMWTDPRGRKIAAERIFEALRTQNHENIIGERTDGYIYHSYPQKGITTTYTSQGGEDMRTPVTFLYFSEETPRQEWKIQDSVKQVLRYTCQLATAQFRGRLWYAWFTPDIPIDNGPWKLSGLPGLIVEAYDSQNYYYYTLTGIQTKKLQPVTFYNYWEKVFEKTTRLDYLKKAHKSQIKYADKFRYTNYDFLELDYHQ